MERMGRLRRSLRDSFRKKRDAPESSKPHQWQADEEAVRGGNSSFHVKYLGSVEVFESRGMPVCEEAMKVLRQSRRRPVKSILHISGDGLRLVEDETKGLILDQTIEKVSFCAPDRNHERGFSYICRDGTTRRWMCHGFLATKDSGERLSHAVGCAFAACLERKQKREKECGVSMTYDSKTSTFTRSGSFRVNSLTDSGSDDSSPPPDNVGSIIRSTIPANTHASRERPHAPVKMLERQGSFRGFSQLANQSPFKRQLSLRLNDLPSNLQRTQQSQEIMEIVTCASVSNGVSASATTSPAPPPRTQRTRLHSLPNNSLGGSTSESNMNGGGDSGPNLMRLDSKDLVSELCQQVTQGLSLLAANHDEKNSLKIEESVPAMTSNSAAKVSGKFTNPWDDDIGRIPSNEASTSSTAFVPLPNLDKSSNINRSNFTQPVDNSWIQNIPGQFTIKPISSSKIWTQPISGSSSPSKLPLSVTRIKENVPVTTIEPSCSSVVKPTSFTSSRAACSTTVPTLPETTTGRPTLVSAVSVQQPSGLRQGPSYRGLSSANRSQSLGADPFDADWATSVARTGQTPTNPFARQPPQQTFQISM